MKRWASIEQIQEANEQIGEKFFTKGAMAFFDTRLTETVIQGHYFITSERPTSEDVRRYSVRRVDDDGRVETVGNLMEYRTREAAYHAAVATAIAETAALRRAKQDAGIL
jgi:hypothetical protein